MHLPCVQYAAALLAEGLFGEGTAGGVIRTTLRMFSQGMKDAVEISILGFEGGWLLGNS